MYACSRAWYSTHNTILFVLSLIQLQQSFAETITCCLFLFKFTCRSDKQFLPFSFKILSSPCYGKCVHVIHLFSLLFSSSSSSSSSSLIVNIPPLNYNKYSNVLVSCVIFIFNQSNVLTRVFCIFFPWSIQMCMCLCASGC